ETEVVEIEAKLDKLVKLCGGMIEAGKAYVTANKLFINGIRDLSQQCKKDQMISVIFLHIHVSQRSVKQQLHNFVKDDVRKFKDTKKHFDKVREDLEIAQVKNAQAPRNKLHEVEEATSTLNFTRKCFRHLALDYVLQINVLQAKKKFEILDAVSIGNVFYSGVCKCLDQLVIDSAMEKREMEHKHATIQQRDFAYDDPKLEFNVNAPNGLVMEGYLFKRASNAFKTWNRRWFSIQNSQLVYQKKLKDSLTVVVEDLRLCSVKPCEDIERRFCFEVVSPTKSCMLQAESEKLRQAWIQAVQASIASAYRESPDNYYIERLDRTASPSISSIDSANEPRERSGRGESILQRILCLPGNQQCCDCGQAEPRWASINLGILLCIECSGIHRSLGVHCSKVRSLTLDSWEPELLKLMCELGNSIINHIYEGSCEEQGLNGSTDVLVFESVVDSVTEEDSSNETELEPEASDPEDLRELDPGALLYKACQARNLPVMAEALAHGADVNSVNEEDEGKSPLIQAVIGGSLIACEFLLQNGADVNQRDHRGRVHAHTLFSDLQIQVCLFLKRGATQNDGDEDGQDPLSIAVQAANADIVTLLRLARMNEEMRESEGPLGQPGDATYLDIFREFSHMASHNPEKLKRRSVHFRHSFR
uniref:Arf-GAP with coiled-coil, ANK repeat and PH domain-containing protein n=1 Tax=Sinocyclocheilus grahami TaxID=75366 RepID=A0A672NI14_SINGR